MKVTPARIRAFSLVEMVMVIVLLGVMAAIAAPRYASFLREQRLNFADLRLRGDIALAQKRARYLGAAVTMTFTPASHRYAIVGMNDPDKVGASYIVNLAQEPYGVTMSSADLGGDTQLIFDGQGTPDSAGTIVLRLGSQTRTIDFGTSVVPWLVQKSKGLVIE